VPLRYLAQLLGVAPDEHQIDRQARTVRELHASLLADSEQRTHQVLAVAHPSRDPVDDDAQGLSGHGTSVENAFHYRNVVPRSQARA
jgi:hypothetical protein